MVQGGLVEHNRPVEWYAKKAGLVYLNDQSEGYTRKRLKDGFGYYYKGKRVRDEKIIKWINSLKIPPSYKDASVWISKNQKSHILAKSVDDKKRTQYTYHPKWTQVRSQQKFQKVGVFGLALSYGRSNYKQDSKLGDFSRENVHGLATWLMDLTSVRVGNEVYTEKEKPTYGITTLEKKHVKVWGSKITLSFVGKSSQEHQIEIKNKTLADALKKLLKLPGDQLFQYYDGEEVKDVTSNSLNDYIESITVGPFTAKDFRTWRATSETMKILMKKQQPETDKELIEIKNEVFEKVSDILGNNPSTTRDSYIYPEIFNYFMDGSLSDFIDEGRNSSLRELTISERATVAMFGVYSQ